MDTGSLVECSSVLWVVQFTILSHMAFVCLSVCVSLLLFSLIVVYRSSWSELNDWLIDWLIDMYVWKSARKKIDPSRPVFQGHSRSSELTRIDRVNIYFWTENGEFWCILGGILCDLELQESKQETRYRPGKSKGARSPTLATRPHFKPWIQHMSVTEGQTDTGRRLVTRIA